MRILIFTKKKKLRSSVKVKDKPHLDWTVRKLSWWIHFYCLVASFSSYSSSSCFFLMVHQISPIHRQNTENTHFFLHFHSTINTDKHGRIRLNVKCSWREAQQQPINCLQLLFFFESFKHFLLAYKRIRLLSI